MPLNFLPTMARLGRDSLITRRLAKAIAEKFDENERNDFSKWLQVVESDKQIDVCRAERKSRGF